MRQDADETLDSYLATQLNISHTDKNFNAIYAATVRYVSSGYASIKDYHDAMKVLVDFSKYEFSASDFRIKLTTVCRFVLKMRFYALTVCLAKNPKRDIYRYEEFGLTKQEAVLAWNHLLKIPAQRAHILRAAKNRHKELCRDLVSPLELRRRIKETQSLFTPIARAAKYQARVKLRWVSVSQNITIEDLTADLMCQVLISYYQSLPNAFSDLYQLNYLKASLTNRVNNMNNKFGAQKRKRMEKSANGTYEIMVLSENQMGTDVNSDGRDGYLNYESCAPADIDISDASDALDKTVAIERLLSVPMKSRRYALNSLMLGRKTVAFTDFLRKNNLCSDQETSIEWMSRRSLSQTVKYVAQWLRVAEHEVMQGMQAIRSAF